MLALHDLAQAPGVFGNAVVQVAGELQDAEQIVHRDLSLRRHHVCYGKSDVRDYGLARLAFFWLLAIESYIPLLRRNGQKCSAVTSCW